MFNSRPEGTISKRKIKRVYPFVTHPDMPDTILELMWTMMQALVPLVITPYFPRALGILWNALHDIEELKHLEKDDVDYALEIANMMKTLEEERSNIGKK